MSKSFKISDRIKSFTYALRGIGTLVKTQHNAQIHLLATILVILMGLIFQLSISEWSLIVLAVVLVWVCEALNTAIEFLADAAIAEFHPLVGKAKDVAAGAVFIASIGSVILALIIFIPKVYMLF